MNVGGTQAAATAGGELRQILAVLGKWRWVIAVVTGTAVLTSGFLSWFVLPKVYEASATVNVVQAVPSSAAAGSAAGSGGQGLQGVVQSVSNLPPATLGTYLWQVTNPVVLAATAQALKDKGVQLAAGQIAGMVKASQVPDTNLIRITATGTDPATVALVANTLTDAYLKVVQDQDRAKLSQAAAFLDQQAAKVEAELAQATADLAKAQAAAGTTPDAQARLDADTKELIQLQGQLVQAQVSLASDQAGLQSVEDQLRQTPQTVPAAALATGSATAAIPAAPQPNPFYQTLMQQVANQRVTVAQDQATVDQLQQTLQRFQTDVMGLAQSGGTQEYVALNAQLIQAQVALSAAKAALANLQQQLQDTPTTLPPAPAASVPNPIYQSLLDKRSGLMVAAAQDQATVTQLQQAIAAVQHDADGLPKASADTQSQIQALQARVSQLTQAYQTLNEGLTQSQVAGSLNLGNAIVTLASPATVPQRPVKPNKRLNLALALLLGLVVSAALSFLLDQLDNTVKTPEDVQRLTGLPTLGAIPHVSR
jgi:succinoglycan biosynthesis transport protein ExoP